MEKFRSWMTGERKSRHTVKQYSFLVGKFLQFVNMEPERITREDIEAYKKHLVTVKGYSRNSQYLCMKAISLFFRYRGIPVPANLNPPKRSMKLPNYLTESETSRLISAAKENRRIFPMLMVLSYTGIRVGELCSLNINDVDLYENIIHVRGGKGDKDRIVIMSDECSRSLKAHMEERSRISTSTSALFVSSRGTRYDTSTVERAIRRISAKAGIAKRVTPHVLRHTFATTLLRNGGDIRFIQQILGHTSISTTQIYTHVDEGMLKEMYSKYRPKY
ncbi:MAG: tyrosine-type recombinase/integrase [Candidatus Thermoplasmatota archaeon]|nr:tyrosine-type recombinase/integrase [Candidatus Thermoplasmatota archaeon]